MKSLLIIILTCIVPDLLIGQALQNINYSYIYSDKGQFTFQMKPVRSDEEWNIYFRLQPNGNPEELDRYVIQWERRNSINEKEGEVLRSDSLKGFSRSAIGATGRIQLSADDKEFFLVAKVIDTEVKTAWYYYETLSPQYPVNGVVLNGGGVLFDSHLPLNSSVQFNTPDEKLIVSHYSDNFPAGAPAFSEGMARVSTTIEIDTTLYLSPTDTLVCAWEGLYLVQQDTGAVRGFAFRAHSDYPKYSTIENLAGPLVYITTRNEFDRLSNAHGDKRTFDRVILGITGDAERAKILMRNYFNRVETANKLFTSYKEGWKTDRGMIYIIFGAPEEVYRFSDREVWSYKNTTYKVTFNFVRSSTLFDPDNFVLVRDKKFTQTWYEVIDLWRNARF